MPDLTPKQFRTEPRFHEALAKLLDNPIYREAEALVKRTLEPRMPESMSDAAATRMGAYSAGGYATLRTLRVLATAAPKQPERQEEYDGWNAAFMQDDPEPPHKQISRKTK